MLGTFNQKQLSKIKDTGQLLNQKAFGYILQRWEKENRVDKYSATKLIIETNELNEVSWNGVAVFGQTVKPISNSGEDYAHQSI